MKSDRIRAQRRASTLMHIISKLGVVAALASCSQALALLSWETTQVTQKADPNAKVVTATFRFTNIGDQPIEIKDIKSSCGCTTTDLVKKSYAPGEEGEIVAKFDIGSRQGLQTKTIRVTTDDGDAPTVLTMKTLVPTVLEIKPSFVFWRKGDPIEDKSIYLDVGLPEVHVTDVRSDNPKVLVKLEEVKPGKRYKVVATPTGTDELLKARITVTTDFPKEKPKVFFLYAHVK